MTTKCFHKLLLHLLLKFHILFFQQAFFVIISVCIAAFSAAIFVVCSCKNPQFKNKDADI
jgi:hypothetical protein